jgi:CrcB protein
VRWPAPRNVGLVAVGGAVGTLARVAVGAAVGVAEGVWPLGTLLANLSGALLLGLVLGLLDASLAGARWVRPLVATGIVGSYTTFSTLSLEVDRLLVDGRFMVVAGYGLVTVVGGLVLAGIGSASAAGLLRLRRGRR